MQQTETALSELRGCIELTREQDASLVSWLEDLPEDGKMGMVWQRYTVMMSPTGVGLILRIRDDQTGRELGLTDIDSF